VDPDPAFHSIGDPYPASKNIAHPCGSGSANLPLTTLVPVPKFIENNYGDLGPDPTLNWREFSTEISFELFQAPIFKKQFFYSLNMNLL
jgi:hypothetical protein